jgi:hypothetical protein
VNCQYCQLTFLRRATIRIPCSGCRPLPWFGHDGLIHRGQGMRSAAAIDLSPGPYRTHNANQANWWAEVPGSK